MGLEEKVQGLWNRARLKAVTDILGMDPAKETKQKGPEEKTKNVGILEAQEREFLEVRVATGGPDAQSRGREGVFGNLCHSSFEGGARSPPEWGMIWLRKQKGKGGALRGQGSADI